MATGANNHDVLCWVLQAIKNEQDLTPAGENVKIDIDTLTRRADDAPAMDTARKCVRLLESQGVFRVEKKLSKNVAYPFEPVESSWEWATIFELTIDQKSFDDRYISYAKTEPSETDSKSDEPNNAGLKKAEIRATKHPKERATPLETLSATNFLSVCDVAMDIEEKLQMTNEDAVYISVVRKIVRFPTLLPAATINLMDEYGDHRVRAARYLKDNGSILNYEFQRSSHRWDTNMKIMLDSGKFRRFYKKLQTIYQKRVIDPAGKPADQEFQADDAIQTFRIEGYSNDNLRRIHGFIQLITNQSELDGWSTLTRLIKIPFETLKRGGFVHEEARTVIKTINVINGEKIIEITNDEVYASSEKTDMQRYHFAYESFADDLGKRRRETERKKKLESWLQTKGTIYGVSEEDLDKNLILRCNKIAPFGSFHAMQCAIEQKLAENDMKPLLAESSASENAGVQTSPTQIAIPSDSLGNAPFAAKPTFEKESGKIFWNGSGYQMPPNTNLYFFCSAMFDSPFGHLVPETDITDLPEWSTSESGRSVENAMRSVNKRIRDFFKIEEDIFKWDRNYVRIKSELFK